MPRARRPRGKTATRWSSRPWSRSATPRPAPCLPGRPGSGAHVTLSAEVRCGGVRDQNLTSGAMHGGLCWLVQAGSAAAAGDGQPHAEAALARCLPVPRPSTCRRQPDALRGMRRRRRRCCRRAAVRGICTPRRHAGVCSAALRLLLRQRLLRQGHLLEWRLRMRRQPERHGALLPGASQQGLQHWDGCWRGHTGVCTAAGGLSYEPTDPSPRQLAGAHQLHKRRGGQAAGLLRVWHCGRLRCLLPCWRHAGCQRCMLHRRCSGRVRHVRWQGQVCGHRRRLLCHPAGCGWAVLRQRGCGRVRRVQRAGHQLRH